MYNELIDSYWKYYLQKICAKKLNALSSNKLAYSLQDKIKLCECYFEAIEVVFLLHISD